MTTISAKVIAYSKTEDDRTISTILTRSPLSYHAQNMTHRVFSRNAASARAIPSLTVIKRIEEDPVYPVQWLLNQPGMQGFHNMPTDDMIRAKVLWDHHRNMTLAVVKDLHSLGLHKQYANRLLAPHQHIDVLWTTASWKNFMHLRNHIDAQPEERLFAQAIQEALDKSTPTLIKPGEWHLPFIRPEDWIKAKEYLGVDDPNSPATHFDILDMLKNISASRCATLSYGNADGSKSDFEKDLARVSKLMTDPLHASPFEHQVTPDEQVWVSKTIMKEHGGKLFSEGPEKIVKEWRNPELHGNLTGFIQYRKTLPNEAQHG